MAFGQWPIAAAAGGRAKKPRPTGEPTTPKSAIKPRSHGLLLLALST